MYHMDFWDWVCLALALVAVMTFCLMGAPTHKPDGRCYRCRKPFVMSGETCRHCGSLQP